MAKQVLVLVVLLCVAPLSALAQKADVGFVVGASFTSDSTIRVTCPGTLPCTIILPVEGFGTIHPDHRIFLEGAFGVRLLDAKLASLHLELPVAGIPSQPLTVKVLSVLSTTPFDHLSSVYVTPAIKVKLLPAASFSPWGSIGGGVAHFSSDSGVSTNKGALQFGGGVDIKTNIPLLGFRAEVRDFLTGDPHTANFLGVPSLTTESGLHRHNLLVGGGVVLRF
ncbi:MAG TPA: hypothetical protein VJA94_11705 [Candidatus Angelobacter sp.]